MFLLEKFAEAGQAKEKSLFISKKNVRSELETLIRENKDTHEMISKYLTYEPDINLILLKFGIIYGKNLHDLFRVFHHVITKLLKDHPPLLKIESRARLESVLELAKKIKQSNGDPFSTLKEIREITERIPRLLGTKREGHFEKLLELANKSFEKHSDPEQVLASLRSVIFTTKKFGDVPFLSVAKNSAQFELLLMIGMKAVEKGIESGTLYKYGIEPLFRANPELGQVKNKQRLTDLGDLIIGLAEKVKENGFYPKNLFIVGIDPFFNANRELLRIKNKEHLREFGNQFKKMIDFICSEKNSLLMEHKVKLIGSGLKSEALQLIQEHYEKNVSRSHRLAFLRGMINMIQHGAISNADSKAEVDLILKDFIGRFGYSTNRDLILVHRLLMKNIPLDDKALEEYQLREMGLTQTGLAGLKELEVLVQKLNQEIVVTGKIDPEYLKSKLFSALIGQITGFNSAQWGHGSYVGQRLNSFIENFLTQKISPLHQEWQELKKNFSVFQLGNVEYSPDAVSKYKALSLTTKEAIDLAETEKPLEKLKESAQIQIEKSTEIFSQKAQAHEQNPMAQAGLARQITQLKETAFQIQKANSIIELAESMLTQKNILAKQMMQALFAQVFIAYPRLKDSFKETVSEALSNRVISKYLELKNVFLKEHVLNEIKNQSNAKELLKVFSLKIFEEESERLESIMGNETTITAYPTRGILGEMAGDIGDACYTVVEDLMSHEHITPVIFSQNDEKFQRLAGSMLILENRSKGEPVLIMRATNPSEVFLGEYSHSDFLKAAIQYAYALADARGIKTVLAPINEQGALSNRPEINKAFEKQVEGPFIKLDTVENLNEFNLTKDVLKKVIRPVSKP